MDGDSRFRERLGRVLARGHRRVRQDHNQSRPCEIGQRMDALRVAFGDGDLEPVVREQHRLAVK